VAKWIACGQLSRVQFPTGTPSLGAGDYLPSADENPARGTAPKMDIVCLLYTTVNKREKT
jgi:hypothetical protein